MKPDLCTYSGACPRASGYLDLTVTLGEYENPKEQRFDSMIYLIPSISELFPVL